MKFKVAIDPGHSVNTAGKRCLKSLDSNETREWLLNSRIADILCGMVKMYPDIEILRTDDITGLTDVSLTERCKRANDFKADLFISIHHNAGINGGSGGGCVVYTWNGLHKTEAQKLYNLTIAQTGLKGNRSEHIGAGNFSVLKYTNMPAFLIEEGFMDSSTDIKKILTDDFAYQCAKGLLDFILWYKDK